MHCFFIIRKNKINIANSWPILWPSHGPICQLHIDFCYHTSNLTVELYYFKIKRNYRHNWFQTNGIRSSSLKERKSYKSMESKVLLIFTNLFKLLLALLLIKHHLKTSKFSLEYIFFHLHCSHNATLILINTNQ